MGSTIQSVSDFTGLGWLNVFQNQTAKGEEGSQERREEEARGGGGGQ
jgi:hypothetical protein